MKKSEENKENSLINKKEFYGIGSSKLQASTKKNNKLIIGVVIALLLIIGVIAFGAYSIFYNNGDIDKPTLLYNDNASINVSNNNINESFQINNNLTNTTNETKKIIGGGSSSGSSSGGNPVTPVIPCTPNLSIISLIDWQNQSECFVNNTRIQNRSYIEHDFNACVLNRTIWEYQEVECVYEREEICSDGIKNQDETDIDCGGLICNKCEIGKNCLLAGDCSSANCSNGICIKKVFGILIDYVFVDELWSDKGILTNGAFIYTEGTRGNVSYFDGFDDYVQLEENLTSGKSELTLSLWIFKSEIDGKNTIYDESYNGNTWQFAIRQDKWYTRDISTDVTGNRDNDLALPIFPINEWHHLVFVYSLSNGTKKIYLDGVLNVSSFISVDKLTTERDLNSWKFAKPTDGYYFNGSLDDILFYNRELNSSEILQMYNSQYKPRQNSICGNNVCEFDEARDICAWDCGLSVYSEFYVSPLGEGKICSSESPCSLSYAIEKINPGQTILMFGGDYGRLDIKGDAYAGDMAELLPIGTQWKTLRALPGEKPIISNYFSTSIDDSALYLGDAWNNKTLHYRFEGIKFAGKVKMNKARGVKFLNCEITGSGELIQDAYGGFSFNSASNIYLDNSTLHRLHDNAISGSGWNIFITNNDISDFGEDGLHTAFMYNLLVENNTIHNNDMWNDFEDSRATALCKNDTDGLDSCTHSDGWQSFTSDDVNHTNITIRNNIFRDMYINGIGPIGLSTSNEYRNTIIEGNIIQNVTDNGGVSIAGGAFHPNLIMRNNTFQSITIGITENAIITNNILGSATRSSFDNPTDKTLGFSVFNNNVYSSGYQNGASPSDIGPYPDNYEYLGWSNLQANLFVDFPNDLHPKINSPACNGSLNPIGVAVGALPCAQEEASNSTLKSTSFIKTIMNFFKGLLTGNTIKEITGNFVKGFR